MLLETAPGLAMSVSMFRVLANSSVSTLSSKVSMNILRVFGFVFGGHQLRGQLS
jgi:hypothetical protein